MAHALYGCKFLRLSIDTISGCYGDLSQPPYTGPFCMSLTQHSVTLTIPHGVFVVVSQTCKLESVLFVVTRYHSAYNTHICDCMVRSAPQYVRNFVHWSLEERWGISHPERHDLPLKHTTLRGYKSQQFLSCGG